MSSIDSTSAASNKSFDIKPLENIGFRPILLFSNHTPGVSWAADKGVYSDPLFYWSTSDKVLEDRRHSLPNVATMLGPTHIKDADTGQYYNLNVLDTDSVTVANRLRVPIRTILDNSSYDWVTDRLQELLQSFLNESGVVNGNLEDTILDILKKSGYVTKTKKEYGYHPYWLSLKQNPPIGTINCLPDKEFELKTNDKYGLCTLPESTHRNDPNFRYKAIGRTDVNLVSNVLYDLFVEMFKDCLVNKKIDDDDTPKQEEQKQQQKPKEKVIVDIKNPVILSPSIIQATAGYASGFVKKGYRHFFDLAFGGMMFHTRISYQSAAQVIAALSAKISDEESESRQVTLEDTYRKGFEGEEIQGGPKLAELIVSKVSGQDIASATLLIDNLKHMWRMDKKASRQREESQLVKLSIPEAKRAQSGYVQVRGSIVAMSTIYQMFKAAHVTCEDCDYSEPTNYDIPQYRPHVKPRFKCPNYSKDHKKGETATAEYEYVPTVDIWLQDLDKSNDLNRLQVKLFDNNTYVNTGEIVDAVGHMHVVRANDNLNSKPESVLFVDDLIYVKRKEITLTQEDKGEIESWKSKLEKNGKSVIDEAVNLFAPHLIGFDNIKKGIFVQCVNAGIKNDRTRLPIRMKLNILLIGDPGTAKGEISSAALDLIHNCQSVNGIASSGISLVAVVNKDYGGAFSVNLGPLALAKDGICRINEIGRLKLDQQPHLFDSMEEGVTDMVKYGFPANIECHASILATANPLNNKWKSSDKISVEEFPVLLQIAHRFDLIYVFRERRDDEFIDAYVDTRTAVSSNYSSGVYSGDLEKLQKYLAYCRTFEPTIPNDVRLLLKHFFKQMAKTDVDGLFRKFDSLLRISIGIAKLGLKNTVDVHDAKEAMNMYQLQLGEFKHHVGVPKDPRDVTYQEIRQIVQETYNIVPGGIAFKDAIDKACERNSQVNDYLPRGIGHDKDYRSLEDNSKLKPILELLRKNRNIGFPGGKPIVMKWNPDGKNLSDVSDVSDVSDAPFLDPHCKNEESVQLGRKNSKSQEGVQKPTSDTSDTSDSNRPKGVYKVSWMNSNYWTCRYCGLKGDKSSFKNHDCLRNGENNNH